MKVRHKIHHTNQHIVIEESPSYYICDLAPQSPAAHAMLSKTEYEPIPTDHWQDVTEECAYTNRTNRIGVQVMQLTCGKDEIFYAPSPNYRLRKVQMWEELQRSTEEWAFRVERKVSD